LAARVGVSRKTIYAIEAGTYVPNTIVSLKLASVLETRVEDLFHIEPEDIAPDESAEAMVIGDTESLTPGQTLRLCSVNSQLVAVVPEVGGWSLPPADAIFLKLIGNRKKIANARIQIIGDKWKKSSRLLLAGCDPSASILTQALRAQGCELVVAYENSSRALGLLGKGLVHIAGAHLVDKATGDTDFSPITKMFKRNAVSIISYAVWEEGLVVAKGNPKHIEGIADLARNDIRISNREPGAGCRRLLDDLLRKKGISCKQVNGYDRVTVGHMPAARLVRSGEFDCCVSMQAVARAMSLDFIPLAEKPYHLVIRRSQLEDFAIRALIETLGHTSFRREVEACTGYDMRTAGDLLYP
jgi:molybdate-binding protein/DNA-binding XRE family transcriptional regulator